MTQLYVFHGTEKLTVRKSDENLDLHIVISRVKGGVSEPEEVAIARQRPGKHTHSNN